MVWKVVLSIVVIILLIIGYFMYSIYMVTKNIAILAFVELNKFKTGNRIIDFKVKDDKLISHYYNLNEKGEIVNKSQETSLYKIDGNVIKLMQVNGNGSIISTIRREGNDLIQTTMLGDLYLFRYPNSLPPEAPKEEPQETSDPE